MSLDARPICLTKIGTVTIHPDTSPNGVQIVIEGFEGLGCSCRDVAALATVWAIGELQKSLMGELEQPGGGATGIG